MKRVRCALALAALLCSLVAPLAGAGKNVGATSTTTSPGTLGITIESFSVPNGPELKTSTAGCNIMVSIPLPSGFVPDSTARVLRDSLAASVAAQANGYTFAISSWPCWVVEIYNPNPFCLTIQNYTGGPDVVQLPVRCVFPGETH